MTLTTQVEATNVVVRKLEEKERILQNALATAEKELSVRQQAMEMHKRKAIESAQSAADLKLHLEKYHAQMKEAQQVVAEKTSALEAEAYKTRRLQVRVDKMRFLGIFLPLNLPKNNFALIIILTLPGGNGSIEKESGKNEENRIGGYA